MPCRRVDGVSKLYTITEVHAMTNTEEKKIDPLPDNQQMIVTPYGNRAEVKDLAQRLQVTAIMPGASKLTSKESLLLAQIAVAHNLDPFNGEVWLIKGKDGAVKGTMIGIKGLRKKARQQLEKHTRDGSFWVKFRQIEDSERAKFVKDETSIIFEATLTDSETVGQWIIMYTKLKKAGMSEEMITQQIGAMPVTVGYGIYNPATEYSKMNPTLVAKKRAEADAIKQRFDVLFGMEYSEDMDETPSMTGDPTDEPFEDDVIDAVVIDNDPFASGRPFDPDQLLNAISVYSKLLPADVQVSREDAEIVQKGILIAVNNKVDVYGKISQYLTLCPAIPAAAPRTIKALWRWLEPKDNPNGNTVSISGPALAEIGYLVDHLKGK